MNGLLQTDRFHLDAAEGWLGLGDIVAAAGELDEITLSFHTHPAVLVMRCKIYEAAKKWELIVPITESLVQQLPEFRTPWIQRSFALHELKRTREAYDSLLPAADRFPELPVIHYNLACYACQLGHLEEALRNLKHAIELAGEDEDIRFDALGDPDLEPLWKQIVEI